MKIHSRCHPESVSPGVSARVFGDVVHALNSIVTIGHQFIVNDTAWYGRRSNGKITPIVMNMAGFISGRFQDTLRDDRGWRKDTSLAGQEIDAYLELESPGQRFRIPPDGQFIEFFRLHNAQFPSPDLRRTFLRCWHRYVRVGIERLDEIDNSWRPFFQMSEQEVASVRIGLEFETGNIASSFRALDKLESLFVSERIDYGVFITSIDKNRAAARIWPTSNRNGSFEELSRRNYRGNRTVPLWEIGFEPDAFDANAPYFNNQTTYMPNATGRTVSDGDTVYEVFLRGSEELLKPTTARHNLHSDEL